MENLQGKIEQYSDKLWKPTNIQYETIQTNSWFDIKKGNNDEKKYINDNKMNVDEIPVITHKCKKLFLIPTKEQKDILLNWMNAYIKMYNQTIKFFRKMYYDKSKISINFKTIRSKYMKNIKDDIKRKVNINSHILDYSIKDACTSYKSALTNMKMKNIKHFRLRYIKSTKPQKILKIELGMFSKNRKTFCQKHLGKLIKTTDGSDFSNVNAECTLQYKYDKFILLIPESIEIQEPKINRKNKIAIDPGIRIPYTGYSEDHTLVIGTNMNAKVKEYINQIDNINNSNKSEKIKEVAIRKRYYKINNMIDEMQWKTIDYLTKNYNTILIGNLSTKDIVKNKINNKLQSISKRISHLMRLYIFHERLKYKCYLTGTKYRKVDEHYTSKTCSICGNINHELGSNKVYDCIKCTNVLNRDVNGARNIYLVDMK